MTREQYADVRDLALGNPAASARRHIAERQRQASQFRGDIEGLRAVAVGLVLLYHAGVPAVPAGFIGVDVFFVISGFLITNLLLVELARTGKISLVQFYARRAKRLLPAVAVVLVATAVLARLLIPSTRWAGIGGDIVSAALYVVNWRLADRSVDYLAEGVAPSPVQHFWSLAVEEQYYLVWPILLIAAALAAKRMNKGTGLIAAAALLLVAVPSFAWSLAQTAEVPARAFFETTTRIWELGVGAAVAVGAGRLMRLPRTVAVGLGWAGVLAIVAAGALFSTSTPWPGYHAALPVLGSAAVIAAGFTAGSSGPTALLATRPFRWVGRLSYSLYLWHWPLVVVATAQLGTLSPAVGLAVVVFSIIPAWLTHIAIENPFRYSAVVSRSPRLALGLGAKFSLVGVAAGLLLLLTVPTPRTTPPPEGNAALGAAALGAEPRHDPDGRPVDTVEWMTPAPERATADIPEADSDGCQQGIPDDEVITCQYGDPSGAVTVAIVGDSKITQWTAALIPLAEHNGWRLVTYLKGACSFAAVMTKYQDEPYEACYRWNQKVRQALLASPPDFVITSQGQSHGLADDGAYSREGMIDGLRTVWSELTARGTRIVVILNNPGPPAGLQVYECVDVNRDRLSSCAFDRVESAAAVVQRAAAEGLHGVEVVDLNDAICPADQCSAVIGNVLVYRQGSHITATYIETLMPRLASELSEAGLQTEFQTSTDE